MAVFSFGLTSPQAPESAGLTSPGSTYDDYPSSDFNTQFNKPTTAAPPKRASEDRGIDSGYAASSPVPIRKSTEEYPPPRKSDEFASESYSSDRRRPSQDTTGRRSSERERDYGSLGRRPSQTASVHSDSTSATNAQSATAGMSMIIPNKSTIAEEEIEVPYGREMRDSIGTATDDRERSREHSRADTDPEPDEVSPLSPPSAGLGGLSGLTARLQAATVEDEDEGALSGGGNKSDDYFDKMSFGRASVASDRSAGAGVAARMGGRSSVNGGDDGERIRREYEFKIATMQTRITALEHDLEDAQLREQKWAESEERFRTMEDELEELRSVSRSACGAAIFNLTFPASWLNRRRLRCWLCRRSLTSCARTGSANAKFLQDARKRTKKNYTYFANVVRSWRRSMVVG